MIERATIIVEKFHQRVHDAGELVHRAFSEDGTTHPREMRLIPCIAWWMPNDRYRVVGTFPTCLRCVAARVP